MTEISIASLSEEESMIEAFAAGEDIHRSTAARVFGVGIDEVTKEQRSHAKSVNFGIIYGKGSFTLGQDMLSSNISTLSPS